MFGAVLLYRSWLFNPKRANNQEGATVRVADHRRSIATVPLPRAPSSHRAGGESWGAVGVAGQLDQRWRVHRRQAKPYAGGFHLQRVRAMAVTINPQVYTDVCSGMNYVISVTSVLIRVKLSWSLMIWLQ